MGNQDGDGKKTPMWKRWWLWAFIGVLVVGRVISNRRSTNVSTSNTVAMQVMPTSVREVKEFQGRFMDYEYTILFQDGASKYVATFQPFLPRNDTVLTGAMLEVVTRVFGQRVC